MDEDQREFLDKVVLQTQNFIESVYDLGELHGQENAWTLTCLLHSAAHISTLVAVTASSSHNDGSASQICKAVTDFLIEELYSNVKQEVMN